MASNACEMNRKGQGQGRNSKRTPNHVSKKKASKTRGKTKSNVHAKGKQSSFASKGKINCKGKKGKDKSAFAFGAALLNIGSSKKSTSDRNELKKNFGTSSFTKNSSSNNLSQPLPVAGHKRQRNQGKQNCTDTIEFAAPTFEAHSGLVPEQPQGELSRSLLTSLVADLKQNESETKASRRKRTCVPETAIEPGKNGFSLLGNDESESDSDSGDSIEGGIGTKDQDEEYVEMELQRMRKRRRKEFIKNSGFATGKETVLLSAPTFQCIQPLVNAEKSKTEIGNYFAAPTFQIQEQTSPVLSFRKKQIFDNTTEAENSSFGSSLSPPQFNSPNSLPASHNPVQSILEPPVNADPTITKSEFDEL